MRQEDIPRCESLDGSTLRIVPAYTEAGMFCEANCVTITDGVRTAIYIPLPHRQDYPDTCRICRHAEREHGSPTRPPICEGPPTPCRCPGYEAPTVPQAIPTSTDDTQDSLPTTKS